MGWMKKVAMDSRGLPRLFIRVMLNEVKHLSEAGGRRILHFVQDDGRPRITSKPVTKGIPRCEHTMSIFLPTDRELYTLG